MQAYQATIHVASIVKHNYLEPGQNISTKITNT